MAAVRFLLMALSLARATRRPLSSVSVVSTSGANIDSPNDVYVDTSAGSANPVIYVTSANHDHGVYRIIPPSTAATYFAGNGVSVAAGGRDGPLSSAGFWFPSGITGETSGSNSILYVSDTWNHAIRRIDVAAGKVDKLSGQYINGGGYRDGPVEDALWYHPVGIAKFNSGFVNVLVVVDHSNHAIRMINLLTDYVTTIAGTPQVYDSARDGSALSALFFYPEGIAIRDKEFGSFEAYIADEFNYGIRLYDHDSRTVTTVAGSRSRQGLEDGPISSAYFGRVTGVAVDNTNSEPIIYAIDAEQSVLRAIDLGSQEVTSVAGHIASGGTAIADGVGSNAHFFLGGGLALGTGNPAYNLYVADSDALREVTETLVYSSSPTAHYTASPTSAPIAYVDPPRIVLETASVVDTKAGLRVFARITDSNRTRALSVTSYTWNITYEPSNSFSRPVRFPNPQSPILYIAPGTLLPASSYTIQFTIEYSSGDTYISSIRRSTTASPLDARVVGGEYRTIVVSRELSLDASVSSDPDKAPDGDTIFEWTCERYVSGSWTPCVASTLEGILLNSAVLQVPGGRFSADNEYRFTVNYTVVSASVTRNATSRVQITTLAAEVPELAISGGLNGVKISVGQTLQLIASARPGESSSSTSDQLVYNWTVADPTGVNIGTITQPALDLETTGLLTGGVSYRFRCIVTDVGMGSAEASVFVHVSAPPAISAVSVSPTSGVAFEDEFVVTAAATGEQPLQYRFASRWGTGTAEFRLSSFASEAEFRASLSAGSAVLIAYVRDALGGESRRETASTVSVSLPTAGAGDCAVINSSVAILRRLATSIDNSTEDMPLEMAVRSSLQSLARSGKPELALLNARYFRQQIEPLASVAMPMSSCGNLSYLLTPGSTAGDAMTNQQLGEGVWERLVESTQEMSRLENFGRSISAQAIQTIMELAASEFANRTGADLLKLSQLAKVFFAFTTPNDAVRANVGNDTASLLSRIVALANGTTFSASEVRCAALDSAVSVVSDLLTTSGEALVPGSRAADYATDSFASSSRVIFSDGSTSLDFAGAAVTLPASASLGPSGSRPRSILSLADWGTLDECRRGKGDASLISSIHSVTLTLDPSSDGGSVVASPTPAPGASTDSGSSRNSTYFVGDGEMEIAIPLTKNRTVPAGGACGTELRVEYWDETTQTWTSDACTTVSEDGETVRARCKHLTEFAVIARSRDQCTDTSDARMGAFLPFFVIYSLFMLFAGWQLFRIAHGKRGIRELQKSLGIAHMLLFAMCTTRMVSALLLSGAASGFDVRTAPGPVVLAVVALPYTFSFFNYTLIIFQWMAISNNSKLSRNPFQRVRGNYIAMNSGAALAAWVIYAVCLFADSENGAIVGATLFSLLFLATAAGSFYFGSKIANLVRQNRHRARHFRRCAIVVGCCFILQTIMMIAAVSTDSTNSRYGLTAAYLFADVCAAGILFRTYWGAVKRTKAKGDAMASNGSRQSKTRSDDAARASSGSQMNSSDLKMGKLTTRESVLLTLQTQNGRVSGRFSDATVDDMTASGIERMRTSRGFSNLLSSQSTINGLRSSNRLGSLDEYGSSRTASRLGSPSVASRPGAGSVSGSPVLRGDAATERQSSSSDGTPPRPPDAVPSRVPLSSPPIRPRGSTSGSRISRGPPPPPLPRGSRSGSRGSRGPPPPPPRGSRAGSRGSRGPPPRPESRRSSDAVRTVV